MNLKQNTKRSKYGKCEGISFYQKENLISVVI
jgi:hypothetical protein